ncbi:peroxisome proliferator-activated receptor gamma coactivator 1-alpha-like [Oppia nitens]|uniref:peroxisome proliferator-activated receptor gamma coactivator 1-alpha-like n=1 Tax=Oppia nitens TaxID=1686743 RepID=UPI0023DB4139|nr:peroxisome proliferator-activated receptor gamma coactivator 1-alpha-like [Oppia nitens]XP_054168013.1 peroxisome proliferator-activated receptor gamma coactivator 1-alpha-like [Oppia nitens]
MTSEDLDPSLIDSCFGDFFTMDSTLMDTMDDFDLSEPLSRSDFEFGLEAESIDTLLNMFEEQQNSGLNFMANETTNYSAGNMTNVANSETKVEKASVVISPKVRKSKTNGSSTSKSKGISLLAKPKKSPAKRSLLNFKSKTIDAISSYLQQEHDYCLVTNNDNEKLYNKIPDYLLSKSFLSNSDIDPSPQSTLTFDKIPDYMKGFLDFNDNNDTTEDILIELNDAYIEVSEVFFEDNTKHSDINIISEFNEELEEGEYVDTEDVNSLITNYLLNEDLDLIDNNNSLKMNQIADQTNTSSTQQLVKTNNNANYNKSNNLEKDSLSRRSRSRSREPMKKIYSIPSTQRSRRVSTRSSVDSSSDSERSSRSSSCSSSDSYLSSESNDSNIRNINLTNSIMRNNSKGKEFTNKRSLKESYCQNSFDNNNSRNKRNVNNMKKPRNALPYKGKQDIDERKIIYVGKIPDGTTKNDLRHWFCRFGTIKEVSVHFRDYGDNYAFVTFVNRSDACQAIEHANEDTRHPKFDLSFGGRRQFCKTRYSDLDYAEDDKFRSEHMDFDSLLQRTKSKITR